MDTEKIMVKRRLNSYYGMFASYGCDILELLNKNIPRYAQLCVGWYHCPCCDALIPENSNYCYKCGQRVIIKGE